MQRDDVIRLAREAGLSFFECGSETRDRVPTYALEYFARLVRQAPATEPSGKRLEE